ncbi:MAG: NusG domain II-containing protein [Clostridia bacterium]|nr:NusG domain II-containing protein [Clostridia bacterium]
MKKLKIGDIILISIILFITAWVFGLRLFGFDDGKSVVVTIGDVERVYTLSENTSFDIENNGISLTVVIENGYVFVGNSNCPEQVCAEYGKISRIGQSIACVPAHLFIKIIGEGDGGYDLIVG